MSCLWRLLKIGILAFFVSTILAVLAYRVFPVYATPLMFIRSLQYIASGEMPRWKHTWVPIEEMSPYLPVAVMASEDQLFLKHNGFDTEAILTAAEEARTGKRFRGGSTISQQTAKNVFLWPTSSWVRKGFEAYFTVLIELFWSKERIMEVYLNSIEMGDGIYGAQAVAEEHFGCDAKDLRRSDCALIAATLPNPLKFSSKSPSAYMRRRTRDIGIQMRHIPLFPGVEYPKKGH